MGNGDGLRLNLSSPKQKVKITEQLLKTLKQNKFEFRLNWINYFLFENII